MVPEIKKESSTLDVAMNQEIVLDYQTHAKWNLKVFDHNRKYIAIFTSEFVILCPMATKLPFRLTNGYKFDFKLFPDKVSGKVCFPDQAYPTGTNEQHFIGIDDLEEFSNVFINSHRLQEFTTLFAIDGFEILSHEFDIQNNLEYQVEPQNCEPH